MALLVVCELTGCGFFVNPPADPTSNGGSSDAERRSDAGARSDGGADAEAGAGVQNGAACPESAGSPSTIEEATKIATMAATCADLFNAQLEAFETALQAVTERVAGSIGDAGPDAASANGTDVLRATEDVRRARSEYANAKRISDEADERLKDLEEEYAAARLWQEGIALNGFVAGGSGERSIRGVGLMFTRRPSPSFEFNLGVDYTWPHLGVTTGDRYIVGRANLGFDHGPVGLLTGAGFALASTAQNSDAIVARVALRYRQGNDLQCNCWKPFGEVQFYIEPWFFVGDSGGDPAWRSFSRETAVFFGVELAFGGAFDRQGNRDSLKNSKKYRLQRPCK
jgi:hypothetical protein